MYNSIDGKIKNKNSPFKKDPVKSKYLITDKKKYYLASIDQNYDQLREVQIQELTQVLTALKSEYDGLIRMTLTKKKETQKLGQQIKMLEKMNARINNKNLEKQDECSNLESVIEMKKLKKEEENFQRITLLHLMEKMREEVYAYKMEISGLDNEVKKFKLFYEKEKIQQTVLMDKINSLCSKVATIKNKNLYNESNNNLILKYYNNVIGQKWYFINSADERKEKQIKIASEAKNDSQDKEEVEKRKVLALCFMYNKYLRKKMEKELQDNAHLEETFQTLKDITGSSNLKTMVDKIMSKDKNYNMHIGKVTEKENKMEIVKLDIKKLEEQYQKLRNDFPDEVSQDQFFTTSQAIKNNQNENKIQLDEDEEALLEEENLLSLELKSIQEKHKDVRLIYEKVTENIKNMCKNDKKNEEFSNNSFNINQSSDFLNNDYENTVDDELVKNFKDHLEYTRKNIESTFLSVGKEEFVKMMKERGEKVDNNNVTVQKNKSYKTRNTLMMKKSEKNISKKDSIQNSNIASNIHVTGYNEYDYSDEEIKADDKKVKEEYDQLVNNYKKKEKMRLMDLAKPDKDKKN